MHAHQLNVDCPAYCLYAHLLHVLVPPYSGQSELRHVSAHTMTRHHAVAAMCMTLPVLLYRHHPRGGRTGLTLRSIKSYPPLIGLRSRVGLSVPARNACQYLQAFISRFVYASARMRPQDASARMRVSHARGCIHESCTCLMHACDTYTLQNMSTNARAQPVPRLIQLPGP